MYFVFGLMAIPLYPIWLANPFYWDAATNVIQDRSRRRPVVASKFACGFALLPIFMDAMERENTAELIPAGNPYWPWAGSMVLTLIASVVPCSVESPSQVWLPGERLTPSVPSEDF